MFQAQLGLGCNQAVDRLDGRIGRRAFQTSR
jgi:hypothetical protein